MLPQWPVSFYLHNFWDETCEGAWGPRPDDLDQWWAFSVNDAEYEAQGPGRRTLRLAKDDVHDWCHALLMEQHEHGTIWDTLKLKVGAHLRSAVDDLKEHTFWKNAADGAPTFFLYAGQKAVDNPDFAREVVQVHQAFEDAGAPLLGIAQRVAAVMAEARAIYGVTMFPYRQGYYSSRFRKGYASHVKRLTDFISPFSSGLKAQILQEWNEILEVEEIRQASGDHEIERAVQESRDTYGHSFFTKTDSGDERKRPVFNILICDLMDYLLPHTRSKRQAAILTAQALHLLAGDWWGHDDDPDLVLTRYARHRDDQRPRAR